MQSDKAIFYHPLDDATESLQSQAWTGTGNFAAGKISSGLLADPGDSVSSFGTATTYFSGSSFLSRIVALSATKIVVAYRRANSGRAKVGTISGTDITFGTEVEWLSSEPSNPPDIALTAISATQVVVAYDDFTFMRAKVGTVSGTDITFGTERIFNSSPASGGGLVVEKLTSTRVILAYSVGSSEAKSRVGIISGTTMTIGPDTQFRSGNTGTQAVAVLSSTTFVVLYRETASSGDAFGRVGTISGNAVTFGTEVALALAIGGNRSLTAAGLSTTKFAVMYRSSGNLGKAKVGTVSGTDVTFGAEAEFFGSSVTDNLEAEKISSSQFAITYRNNLNDGDTKIGTVSGTDVTFGAATEHNGGTDSQYNTVALLDSTSIVVGYTDGTTAAAKVGTLAASAAARTAPTPGAYATAAAATKVGFVGWLKNPSA
ncbi:MAG: hypothetical protein ACE5E8_10755 [Acidimicrobiia bacterium]